ncbi:MAG: protein-L-isoaspartate(D-aspartate) O-methyltransferase [Candidatus Berkelbacteria bacterium Licking1014_96]|uniref:Protein-L-isoaspartate O-methyltransferase n=1 Tax=Candidatus Berkelbacteria bacterium Licking1014_96 TaxID=2017149 RepID=A0A554LEZ6_9BACT|nr:MAG: protein-L-isoaspartate(D-aspartate) O-methyltransferase [Candidatus Berkelbacteria bacterium Licking1014_96]
MKTNEELVNYLIGTGALKSLNIIRAMSKIDRKDFVGSECESFAYDDSPCSIGYGQTISQPTTVAFIMEQLQPQEGERILDIGYGSGWTTAILASIVGDGGRVFAIELISILKKFGENNAKKYKFQNITFIEGDGSRGLAREAPFDRILVSAAAPSLPSSLKEQLKISGRLVIPVGRGMQSIYVIERIGEKAYKKKKIPGFVFVELKMKRKKRMNRTERL